MKTSTHQTKGFSTYKAETMFSSLLALHVRDCTLETITPKSERLVFEYAEGSGHRIHDSGVSGINEDRVLGAK